MRGVLTLGHCTENVKSVNVLCFPFNIMRFGICLSASVTDFVDAMAFKYSDVVNMDKNFNLLTFCDCGSSSKVIWEIMFQN